MLPKWTQAAPLASSIASSWSASPSVSVVVATQERIGPGARSLQGIVLEDRLPIEHRQPFPVRLEAIVDGGPDAGLGRDLTIARERAAAWTVALVLDAL